MTREMIIKATDAELDERVRELRKVLEMEMGEAWDEAYKEYCFINSIWDERYYNEHIGKFTEFFAEYIEGKKWNEIDPEILDSYSDWHKDLFGYRPRNTIRHW